MSRPIFRLHKNSQCKMDTESKGESETEWASSEKHCYVQKNGV